MKGDYIISTKDFVNLISSSGFTAERQRGSHQTFVHEVSNATIQVLRNKPTIGTGILKDQLSILVFSQLVSNNNPNDVGKWVENIKDNKIQNLRPVKIAYFEGFWYLICLLGKKDKLLNFIP